MKDFINERSKEMQSAGYGKIPPQAIDIEKAILGAMLIEKECISRAIAKIKSKEVFYLERHQLIYEAMVQLFGQGDAIDMMTVVIQLRKNQVLEQICGAFYIGELTEQVNSSANIESHCKILAEYHTRRKMIAFCSTISAKGYDETQNVFELLDSIQTYAIDLTNQVQSKAPKKLNELVMQANAEINAAMTQKSGITGVASGLPSVDMVNGGWQKSDLIIIAARPAMGKTTVVLNFLKNAAFNGDNVMIFSLEMSGIQLAKKIMSMQSGLTTNQLVKGQITNDELLHLQNSSSSLLALPFTVEDSPGITIEQLRAKCMAEHIKKPLSMIVIDYLQLIAGKDSGRGGNREQEIASISRGLKNLAKELNVPVIALSQLSRGVESRPDKRPMLSDLRESGSIEQDADVVCFLYRPAYYKIMQDEAGFSTENLIEFNFAKHRNGPLATVNLREELKFSRIHEWNDFKAQVWEEEREEKPSRWPVNADHFDSPF